MAWADKFTDEELFFMVNQLISYLKKDKENTNYNNRNELFYGIRERCNFIGSK
jgi:hypothetical protein